MDAIRDALSAEQAGSLLGISASRVRQLAQAGRISGIKRAKAWFFAPEAIEAARNRPKSKGGRGKKAGQS